MRRILIVATFVFASLLVGGATSKTQAADVPRYLILIRDNRGQPTLVPAAIRLRLVRRDALVGQHGPSRLQRDDVHLDIHAGAIKRRVISGRWSAVSCKASNAIPLLLVPSASAHCPLPTAHCPLTTAHCPLTTDHRPPTTDHRPPTADHSTTVQCPS